MDERRTSRTARFIVYDVKTTFPWYILHRQERLTTLSLNGPPTGKLHRIFICVIIMWVRSSCLTFSKSSSTCYYVYIFLITCNCLLLSHNLHYFMIVLLNERSYPHVMDGFFCDYLLYGSKCSQQLQKWQLGMDFSV